jgi:hypothetical protein
MSLTAERLFYKKYGYLSSSVAVPYPSDPYVLGLLDPVPDPLVRGMDPAPDPSIIKQNRKKNLDLTFIFENYVNVSSKSNKQKNF